MLTLSRQFKPPKLPRPGAIVAASLEVSMLIVMLGNRSLLGALLWAAYFWFSASYYIVLGQWRDKEEE